MTVGDEYALEPVPEAAETNRYGVGQDLEQGERCTAVFARDILDSMAVWDRTECALETFTEIEQVLDDFYDTSDLQYVCFDRDAYTVEKHEFFKPHLSGGRTRIEPAYEAVAEHVEDSEDDTYVFLASDDNLHPDDDTDVIQEAIERMPADLHAYLAVDPYGEEDGLMDALPAPDDGGSRCFVIRDDDDRADVVMAVVDAITTIRNPDAEDGDTA